MYNYHDVKQNLFTDDGQKLFPVGQDRIFVKA